MKRLFALVLPPVMQEKLARRYGEIVAAIVRRPSVTMLDSGARTTVARG